MSEFISDEVFANILAKRLNQSSYSEPLPLTDEAPQSEGSGCSLLSGHDAPSAPVVSSFSDLPQGGAIEVEGKRSEAKPFGNIKANFVLDENNESHFVGGAPSVESSPDFDGLDIKDPVELLLLLDENILSGEVKLHDWQIQFMLDFANPKHDKRSPFKAVVQACNGSGKDKYIIAACAVWICMRYKEVECPITSSSGDQLDNQTGAHIDRLTNKANAVFGKLWKIQYRYYEFLHTGPLGNPTPSKLKLFATDEPGKAEGYHPVDAGKKMAIFTSETKSIPESITSALTRCTGYTHRVDASSPGLASGYFYEACSSAIPREELEDIKALTSIQSIVYKITAYQCNHILTEEIEAFAASLPGGKNNQVFRSGMLAEFGATDMMVVIPSSYVWRAVQDLPKRSKPFEIKWIQEEHNKAGLDLSDGGAETVLATRNGNKLLYLDCFRLEDTEDTINHLEHLFAERGLKHKDATINGDYCGLGGPMLRSLKRRGWSNVHFIDSRNASREPKTYSNRGTELFFHLRKLLENQEIILFYDKLLINQLCTRYYKIGIKLIHQLLTKLEQRSKGYPSPDRADAVNLAFWDYKSTGITTDLIPPFEEEKEDPAKVIDKVKGDFDMLAWAEQKQSAYNVEHVQEADLDDLREQLKQYNKQRRMIGVR